MRDGREYVSIPGYKMHQLPPLLVRRVSDGAQVDMASAIEEAGEMLPEMDVEESLLERRKFDLAVTLAEQYRGLIAHWQWGESIVEWIRQCEMTFGARLELRNLLRPDVWPHAGRRSHRGRPAARRGGGLPGVRRQGCGGAGAAGDVATRCCSCWSRCGVMGA